MKNLFALTAAVSFAASLTLAAAPVLAAEPHLPSSKESVVDQQRCETLTQQWNKESAGRSGIESAAATASEGAALCRAGRYGEGAETLQRALTQIGVKPM